MVLAYKNNLMYSNKVDSSTERKGGFRPPCHNNIVRMNTTEVFMIKKVCPVCGKEFVTKRNSTVFCSRICSGQNHTKDLTGQRFGKLVALKIVGKTDKNNKKWLCKCDCGNEVVVRQGCLHAGITKSCGCMRKETLSKIGRKYGSNIVHGLHETRLYKTWQNMKNRCRNPRTKQYKDYGGRGIIVCAEWQNFQPFYDWAMENGYKDNLTIDRINVNGNYEPSNCRWVTMKEQANNTRRNHFITINNETHTIAEWARIYNIKRETIKDRISRGWDEVKAVITPIKTEVK